MWKGEKQAPLTLIKQWKEEEGNEEGKQPPRKAPRLNKILTLKKTLTKCKLLQRPLVQEYAHAHILMPLTTKIRLVLLNPLEPKLIFKHFRKFRLI